MKQETFKNKLLSKVPSAEWDVLCHRYWDFVVECWDDEEFRPRWLQFLKTQLASVVYHRSYPLDTNTGTREADNFKCQFDKWVKEL